MATSAYAERSTAARAKAPAPAPGPAHRRPAGVDHLPGLARDEVARPGHPLEAVARTEVEQRFGQDFSHVRVHSDQPAAESARMLGARAYTVGEHVVFSAGRLAPHTPDGRRLLAHELAHVTQQRRGDGAGPSPTRQPPLEAAADAAADAVAHGTGPVAVTGESGIGLAMAEETGGLPPPTVTDYGTAYARLGELQLKADDRAFHLMAGVVRNLRLKRAGSQPSPPGTQPAAPASAATAEEEASLVPGWARKELTVAVGYAVDENGTLHELVTTSRGQRRKLVDLGPNETWVKAIRGKKPPQATGAAAQGASAMPAAAAPTASSTTAQHGGAAAVAGQQPQRKRTAEQAIGDAESRLVAYAAANRLRLIAVGASNNICPHCASKLGLAGSTTGTPRAGDPLHEHVPVNIGDALELVRKLPAKPAAPPPVVERRRAPLTPGTQQAATATAAQPAPAQPVPAKPVPGAASQVATPRPPAPEVDVDDDADTEVIQHAQAAQAKAAGPTAPGAAAPGTAAPGGSPASGKVTTTGDLSKVARKRTVDEGSGTGHKVSTTSATVGWGEASTRKERLETRGGTGTKTVTGVTAARGEGSLTVTRGREESKGVFDEEGKLLSGTSTSYHAGGGIVAGPEGYGVTGSATAQQTTVYGNGFSRTKQLAGTARVVVNASLVEGSAPPRYQLLVVVTVGASGSASVKSGERASASGSMFASGSVTATFTHEFTVEQTRRYLGDLDRNGGGGAERELQVLNLAAHGSLADARQMLAAAGAPLSASAAAQLPEGDQATLAVQGGVGGSLGAAAAPVGAEVSFSKSKSLKRTVARREGAVLLTVEVVAETSGSLGASGSSGLVSGGIKYDRKVSSGQSVTFRLDPSDPSYQASFERILAADNAADLTALAASDPGHVAGKRSSSGWATTLTPKVSLAGAEAAISTTHAYSEKVDTDAVGARKKFAGSTGGGVVAGLAGGPELSYHAEQAVSATVGPDRKATADVSTTTSESDVGASAKALTSGAEKAPIGTAAGLATGGTKLVQSRTEVIGMRLSDQDFDAILATSQQPVQWGHAFRGYVNQSYVAWGALGSRIAASGGDREAISRALTQYASGNDGAAEAVQAVVRPQGQVEGGKRYDWPEEFGTEREAYESIVLGDHVAQLRARAAAGAFEEAQAGLAADSARLDRAAQALTSSSRSFADRAAVAEMLRRIVDVKKEIRQELHKLDAALAPAAPERPAVAAKKRETKPGTLPAPSGAKPETQPAPAFDEESVKERDEQIRILIPALLTLRSTENETFAKVRKELNDPPWYRGPDVIGIIQTLSRLDPLYTQWDALVEKLRAVFRERGQDGSEADHYGPDRKTRDELRHHPELTKWG